MVFTYALLASCEAGN